MPHSRPYSTYIYIVNRVFENIRGMSTKVLKHGEGEVQEYIWKEIKLLAMSDVRLKTNEKDMKF